MESFFLAETTKYLYLLFDEYNFIHHSNGTRDSDYKTKATLSPSCTAGGAGYIFNTEAHPIDIGAIHCCMPQQQTQIQEDVLLNSAATGKDNKQKQNNVFTGKHVCKARPFQKRFSVLGAFFEKTDEN